MTYLFCLINLFKNSVTIEMILLMCYSVQTLYKYVNTYRVKHLIYLKILNVYNFML